MKLIQFSSVVLIYLRLFVLVESLPRLIKLGALFTAEEEEQEIVFQYAVERVNADPLIVPISTVVGHVERIGKGQSFQAHQKVCGLLRNGVSAIFGPIDGITSMQVQSICDALEIPHIETRWDFNSRRADLSINLFPRPTVLSNAYFDLVQAWAWKSFAIVYEENEGVIRVRDFFMNSNEQDTKWDISVYQFSQYEPFRNTFWQLKEAGVHNIVLDVRKENLYSALRQAQQVGLMTERENYLVTSLDLHTIDLDDFRYSNTSIVSLSMVDMTNPELHSLLANWPAYAAKVGRRSYSHTPEQIQIETGLLYDAVKLTAIAMQELDQVQKINFSSISCEDEKPWKYGSSLINYMRPVTFRGITGLVAFDQAGMRTGVSLDVMSVTYNGIEKIATWSEMAHSHGLGLNITSLWKSRYLSFHLKDKTFKITCVYNAPYIMKKDSVNPMKGNEQFEGYVVDLMDELAKLMHFRYEIFMVKDGNYGSKSPKTGLWNGMIGEVLRGEVDMAVADLSINSERETVVDFTYPFINTGISILYRKPMKKVSSLFSFLSPFSATVWIYMFGSFIGVSAILFIAGRFSPYEWNPCNPCRQQEKVLENIFGLLNSFWFMIGSLMQQGCDLAPTAMSTRSIAGIWYFFVMIMISSYTANLAAFLTIELAVSPIEKAEDLAIQEKIKYGSVASGSTRRFFANSNNPIYARMGKYMESHPEVFVNSNSEGVNKVLKENGNYAYLMEAATIEYIVEGNCNLTQVGGLLDNKGYGIAVRKNSHIRNELSEGILRLQESGMLHVLKNRWWKDKRKGGTCNPESSSGAVAELGISNVGGVFLVLIVGLIFAFILAIGEFMWKANKNTEKGNWVAYMKKDLRYISDCQSSTKPVMRDLLSRKSLSRSKSKTPSRTADIKVDQQSPFPIEWNSR